MAPPTGENKNYGCMSSKLIVDDNNFSYHAPHLRGWVVVEKILMTHFFFTTLQTYETTPNDWGYFETGILRIEIPEQIVDVLF